MRMVGGVCTQFSRILFVWRAATKGTGVPAHAKGCGNIMYHT